MAVAGWDDEDGSQPGGDLDPDQRENAASAAERLLAAAVHVATRSTPPSWSGSSAANTGASR